MLYFIVTTCISPSDGFKNKDIRESQYIRGIYKLKEIILNLQIKKYKIIIVENTNNKYTFLDTLGCTNFYTSNNFLKEHKGYKELQDILDCIDNLKIDDNDFIVKMSGRYILEDDSEFMNIIKDIDDTKYDCVIKYGPYSNPVNYKMNDCITGLIGMRCKYIKMIEKPNEKECVEWKWGEVTNLIEDKNIYKVNKLGINICPGSNRYFKV